MFYLHMLLPLAGLLFAFAGTGFCLLYPLRNTVLKDAGPGITLIIQYMLGQGFLSCLFMLLALGGLFHFAVIFSIVGIMSLAGLYAVFGNHKLTFRRLGESHKQILADSPLWYLLLVASFLFWLYSFGGLAGLFEGDCVAYYYVFPKLTAASGTLLAPPVYQHFMASSINAEMFTAALMLLGMPDITMRLLPWLNCLPVLYAVYALLREYGNDRRLAVLGVALVSGSSAFGYLGTMGKLDGMAIGQGAVALLCLYKAWGSGYRRFWLFLCGLMCGFAGSFKISYLVILGPCVFFMSVGFLGIFSEARAWKTHFKTLALGLAVVGLGTALPMLVHFAKNWVMTGAFMEALGSFAYFSPKTTLKLVLSYPLALVFGKYWAQNGHISTLLISLIPLALLLPPKKWFIGKPLLILTVGVYSGLATWLVLFPSVFQPRYILLILLLLALPFMSAAVQVGRKKRLCSAAIVGSALISIWGAKFELEIPKIIDFTQTVEYLRSQDPGLSMGNLAPLYYAHEAVNQAAGEGERVYFMYYQLWLRPELILSSRKGPEEVAPYSDANAFWNFLEERGFSFIISDFSSTREIPAEFLLNSPPHVQVEEIYRSDRAYNASCYKITYLQRQSD